MRKRLWCAAPLFTFYLPLFTIHFSLFTFISCDVRHIIHDTPHPDEAQITVITEWSGVGTGIEKPTEYYVDFGKEELKITQDEFTFPELFDPGSHTLQFYNHTENIDVNMNTATASYEASIGWLFTGRLQETVVADKDYVFTVPMRQQVRQLTLVIALTGGTTERIESINATLSGIATTLEFETDTHGSPTDVALSFTKDSDDQWVTTVRLLGIAHSEQRLTGIITFANGTPPALPLESDLTEALALFNTDKKTPLSLGGTVAETPTSTGFTSTISDWEKHNGTVIAN